jgi:hypothetical protein
MPNWLQQMFAPTLMLWVCILAWALMTTVDPEGVSTGAETAWSVALSLVIALWVLADARKRGQRLCYDYDSFVYFAWPVVVPAYLFQTRGWRALLTLLCFAGIWLVAIIGAAAVSLVRQS